MPVPVLFQLSTVLLQHSNFQDQAKRNCRMSMNSPDSITPISIPQWRAAADLAVVLDVSKRTVLNYARKESWPTRQVGNRLEFLFVHPEPAGTATDYVTTADTTHESKSVPAPDGLPLPPSTPSTLNPQPSTTLASPRLTAHARQLAQAREQAVLHCLTLINNNGVGKEAAIAKTVSEFCTPPHSAFRFSGRTLRRWLDQYQARGVNGLTDQKAGRVGRKPAADHLTDYVLARGHALAVEHGQRGQPNVSRAARILQSDPELPAPLRDYLHSAHASKSYVTPSLRAALKPAPLTLALTQGPRAARLAGRFTPRDYSDLRPGDMFTSDDMTSNILAWCEWPGEPRGWRIAQPQILPVMDIASLRWLNVRVIMRASGNYTADDIWGLFGDVFDLYGLPNRGFLLEGGSWQANQVQGFKSKSKTGLGHVERISGLKSLGLEVHRSFDPRSKGMLEGAFHHFQSQVDAFRGFVGREQRQDRPEAIKEQLRLCKNGQAHPRQFFPHLSELADHVQKTFMLLNDEIQEGQILRGRSPNQAWEGTQLSKLPPEATWLYRSAKTVAKVTRNGIRITQGSGPGQVILYFDNPQVLAPRQGTKVLVHWNDDNHDADAAVLDFQTRAFIGLAPRVQPRSAFNATKEQLSAEAKRKQAALGYARTELRAMQPHLQRHIPATDDTNVIPVDPALTDTGAQLAEANRRAELADRQKHDDAAVQRRIARRVAQTPDDLLDLISTPDVADTDTDATNDNETHRLSRLQELQEI